MLEELSLRMRAIRNSFEKANIIELRMQSSRAIRDAAFSSDKLLAQISLIAYSLHKMSIKTHISNSPKWGKVKATILRSLDESIKALDRKDVAGFEKELSALSERVIETDNDLGHYAANLYEKARIKMASSAYGFGLSLSQSAELTGADKKQLLNYIGITKMHDETIESKGIEDRVKMLEKTLVGD